MYHSINCYIVSKLFQNFGCIRCGSEPSMDAVDYAIYIAQKNGADLTALYVASSPTEGEYICQKIKFQKQ
jgi:hypothetical protein